MKSKLLKAYSRLLADLATQTDAPLLEARWNVSEEWALKCAPLLDKAILGAIEFVGSLPTKRLSLEKDVIPNWMCVLDCEIEGLFFSNEELYPKGYQAEMLDFLRPFIWRLTNVEYRYRTNQLDEHCKMLENLIRDVKIAHQSLVYCYKAEYEPSNEQIEETYRIFEQNDASIEVFDQHFQSVGQRDPLYRTARTQISRVIYKANWEEIAPKHGPGAVWPPSNPCSKSDFKTYYRCIDDIYPYSDWMIGMPSVWHSVLQVGLREVDEIVCRVQAVPKDSRGPRIICVHPKEAVWIQQGTRHVLERAISQSHLTHGKINFHDQSVNGQLALKASLSREYVTLDLKDASDRLSAKLVAYLFGDYAYKFIGCSRATKVQIGNRVITLQKYAPMGNALTFPVQSLCFWAIVRAGISLHYGETCDDVFVFGDDIIYPSKYHRGAVNALVRAGLIPNMSKTFVCGSFRESCGVDAIYGTDITPLRLKVADVNSVSDAVSACSLAFRAKLRGYDSMSAYLYRLVEDKYGHLSMTNNPNSQGLIRYEDLSWDKLFLLEKSLRFNRNFHRWEVPTKLITNAPMSVRKHEWFHVQDSLLDLWRRYDVCRHVPLLSGPSESCSPIGWDGYSERRLEYPDPRRTRLNRGWTEVLMK